MTRQQKLELAVQIIVSIITSALATVWIAGR